MRLILPLLTALLLMASSLAWSANRPITFHWDAPTENVSDEPLDENGDGDPSEGLTGYNIYRVACTKIDHDDETNITCGTGADIVTDNERIEIMVADIEPWSILTWDGSFNLPFNPVGADKQPTQQHCFVATAYWRGEVEQTDGSMVIETNESGNSNIVCKAWTRRTPKPPGNNRSTL
jgi:hypothetical protein